MDGLIYLLRIDTPYLMEKNGINRLARNSSSRTICSPQSLQILKNGRTHLEICSNEDDFMKYVEELETNGNYEEAHTACVTATDFLKESLSNENDYDKKRSIQHRIELCSLRAERLYNMYLSPEVKNLLPKVYPVIKKSIIQKPAISEIYKYNVISKEDSGMLVLHPDTQKKFYVKVINKTTSFSDDNLIIPESIPYMVQLHNFYNCDNSIFLILEYVNGSKLSDYLNKVRLKFENNETFENLYDKAVDLDIPDDDSENSFTDLVTNYTKVKKDIVEGNDFENVSRDDSFQTVHPVSLQQTESNFSYNQRRSSIPINTETEQNVDLLQHEIIVKWAAQLILALEKLHTLGIVCKDLRLHNLLINEKGNLTLTYMCNAKESCNIFINKRDLNLAPEVQGIGPVEEEADWWSLGAIFYEILVGMSINDLHPEYFHQSTILRVPKYVSPEGRSLLRQLLVYEPKKRLGTGPHGIDNLKSHPFFKGIDWNALLEQSLN